MSIYEAWLYSAWYFAGDIAQFVKPRSPLADIPDSFLISMGIRFFAP